MTIGTFAEFLSVDGKFPISEIDASIVRRVLEAGGTVAGTAVCENYSAAALSYSPATGPVQNPWVKGYATGGSSSGCAALLAATLKKRMIQGQNGLESFDDLDWDSGIELAIGGDQGGSIRIVSSTLASWLGSNLGAYSSPACCIQWYLRLEADLWTLSLHWHCLFASNDGPLRADGYIGGRCRVASVCSCRIRRSRSSNDT